MSERELIKGCLENNRQSQKIVYEQFHSSLWDVCLRYSDTEENAHDMLQQGFVQIIQKLKTYKEPDTLADWIKKTIIPIAIDHVRKLEAGQRMIVSTVHELKSKFDINKSAKAEVDQVLSRINYNEILEALRKMTSGYRIVYNLHYSDGFTFEEIAKILSISEQTAKTNFERARFSFRNNLLSNIEQSLNSKTK